MWRCSACVSEFDTIKGLFLHLKLIHSLSADSTYCCHQNNCNRKYSNAKSFRKHLGTHSSEEPQMQNITSTLSDIHVDVITPAQAVPGTLNIPEKSLTYNSNQEILNTSLENLATWLYGHSELNRKTANDILVRITQHVTEPIGSILSKQVLPFAETSVKSCLDDISKLCKNPFNNMTEHNILKYLKDKGHFVYPRTFVIDDSINIGQRNSTVRLIPKQRTGFILPLAKALKQFFEKPGVLKVVTDYMQELILDTSSSISNIIQSDYWKEKIRENLGSKDVIIPLYIYFDDFECGNALGSHAGSQSIAATYCQIACLPPQYSAMLENIFVAMLHYSSDKSFGNGTIFRELVKDLNHLDREGVIIKSPNGPVKLYFKLALILGDNLGLNTALGFSKSFSSNYYCRICKAHKSSMITESKQNDQLLRTRENYENDVHLNDPRNTGIREECVFNSITSFHVVENLSVDIMHDIFEGVCHYDLSHIILYYIEKVKIFDLNTINNRIQIFNYLPRRNVPGKIKREHLINRRLHTSASEMITLIYYLPILAGDLVPNDDVVWNFLLVLVQIVETVLDRSFSEESICRLESLIAEHHIEYVNLFKDNLKPKHHFMIHYPHIMRKLGPLRNLWCMRFEAKHRVLKNIANNTSSRKNLPYTLMVKEQLNVASRIQNGQKLKKKYKIGKVIQSDFVNINDILKRTPHISVENKVEWVEYNSIKFAINNIITLTPSSGYEFYMVKAILNLRSGEVLLLCAKLSCVGFNEHLRSYQINVVEFGHDLSVIDVSAIIVFPCTPHTLSNGDTYCRVRYI